MNFWEGISRPYLAVAPMVGNSEEAWRRLGRRYGANMFYTEMVHCEAFLRGNRNPVDNLWYTTSASDRPLVVQICGNSADAMLRVGLIIQEHCDAIDINLGCPQQVAKRGYYGAYLQDDWELVGSIVRTLSSRLLVPVTCKIRVFESVERSVEYARMIEDAGCALLAVHGRTREQRGTDMGLASWRHIRAIKEAVGIPVLSNGNIMHHDDIERCLEYTKCDGVMVGETHLYNPLVFTGKRKTCLEVIGEYLDICRGDPRSAGLKHVRSHLFKLLHTYFAAYPWKRRLLDACGSVEEIHSFYLGLVEEKESGGAPLEAYEMNPRPLVLGSDDGMKENVRSGADAL